MSGPFEKSRRSTTMGALAGMVLLIAYAAPMFAPPPTEGLLPPVPGASLLARLFPGVPEGWIAVRLICLAAGITVLTMALPTRALAATLSTTSVHPPARVRTGWALAAVIFGGLQVIAAIRAQSFGRTMQLVYVATLFVPALLLAAGSFGGARREASRIASTRTPALLCGLVIAGWVISRGWIGHHSSRAADAVDGWDAFACLASAAKPEFNLLVDGCYAGFRALPLILQGAGILGTDLASLDFQTLQALHLFWLACAAAALAWVAGSVVSPAAAPVAAAVFLFAPIEMSAPLWASGAFVFGVYGAALLALALRVERTRSPAALVAFAVTAAVSLRCPPLPALTAVVSGWLMWSLWVGRGVPALVVAAAALSFCAVLVPGLGLGTSLIAGLASYTGADGSWQTMEAALFGLVAPSRAEAAIRLFASHAGDIPLSLLFSPFAIPRTAVRLWGDAILDPIGAVLVAVGVAAALGALRVSKVGRALLLLLALTMLPGILSSYDRVSTSRIAAMAVPLALLAAAGFDVCLRVLAPRMRPARAAAVVSLAVGCAGTFVFDLVNSRVLARSPLGVVVDRIAVDPALANAVVLEESLWKPRYVRMIAEQVPSAPVRTWPFATLRDFDPSHPEAPAAVFWTPGEEEEWGVSEAVCRAWPDASVFVLHDTAGLTTVFAARRSGASSWREQGLECTPVLPTERSRGERAIVEARALAAEGRLVGAAEVLETQARRTFAYTPLFQAAAHALLALPQPTREQTQRALEWALRGCAVTKGEDPDVCATVAEAHAARGSFADAIRSARLAKDAALQRGDGALAGRLESRIQEFARSTPAAR